MKCVYVDRNALSEKLGCISFFSRTQLFRTFVLRRTFIHVDTEWPFNINRKLNSKSVNNFFKLKKYLEKQQNCFRFISQIWRENTVLLFCKNLHVLNIWLIWTAKIVKTSSINIQLKVKVFKNKFNRQEGALFQLMTQQFSFQKKLTLDCFFPQSAPPTSSIPSPYFIISTCFSGH